MSAAADIAVLVSCARHPLSGTPCANRNDAIALELARSLAGSPLRVLHAGDPEAGALAEYLAFGARLIEVLPAPAGAELLPLLIQALQEQELVLTGSRALYGTGSGMLPYMLAQGLHRPMVGDVLEVALEPGRARVQQFLPKGRRRSIEVSLPAVLAIHPLAPYRPRYAYARRLSGQITGGGVSAVAAVADADAAAWVDESQTRMAVRLQAPDNRPGHARMLAAIGSPARGGTIMAEGSSLQKAETLLAYLRQHELIDF